jgi:hypothetical protein
VSIWDKTAEAQARAMLESGPIVATDVRVGRLLQVELAALQSGEFSIHAMTPAKQLLFAGGVVSWEWTIVPLQPGEHELSVVATNLADFSGKPLNLALQSMSVKVEVTQGKGHGRDVDKELIRKVIRSHIDEVKRCYESELEKNDTLAGRVLVQFSIGANGKIIASMLTETTLGSPVVEKCIVDAVRGWEFPKPERGIMVVTYPFILKTVEEGSEHTPLHPQ